MLIFTLFVLMTFVFVDYSHAYIDPGASTIIFQMIAAGIVSLIFYFKKIISQIMQYLGSKVSVLLNVKINDYIYTKLISAANVLQKQFNSSILLIVVSGLAPAFILSRNNWNAFYNAKYYDIILSLTLPLILSISLYLVMKAVFTIVFSIFKIRCNFIFNDITSGIDGVALLVSALVIILCLDVTLKSAIQSITGIHLRTMQLMAVALFFCIPLLIMLFRSNIFIFYNFIIVSTIIISSITIIYEMISYGRYYVTSAAISNISADATQKDYKFTKKPNCYFIVPDSYPSQNIIKYRYGINNSNFTNQLNSRYIHIFDNSYANYDNTLASIQSVYTMKHHYYMQSMGSSDSLDARKVISAIEKNNVIDVFKKNGYKINYILGTSYLCPFPDQKIDYFISYKDYSLCQTFYPQLYNIAEALIIYIGGRKNLDNNAIDYNSSWINNIDYHSEFGPVFTYIHMPSPGHAYDSAKASSGNEYKLSNKNNISTANKWLIELVDTILSKDSDPFIIIMGDHGQHNLAYAISDRHFFDYDLNDDIRKKGLTNHEVADDMFGITLAVRFPSCCKRNFKEAVISPVNLFRYIFAVLDDTYAAGIDKENDVSYVKASKLYIAIRNGKTLERWQSQ